MTERQANLNTPLRGGRWLPLLTLLLVTNLPGATNVAPDPQALARRIHQEVNIARAREGLPPLAWDGDLATIAQAHSADMVARDYFSHANPEGRSMRERYEAAGYACTVAVGTQIYVGAENIAMHTLYERFHLEPDGGRRYEWLDDAALARRVVAGWMESAGHRRNLLASHWRSEGLGLAFNTVHEVLITQNFC